MNNQDLKEALLQRHTVVYKGTAYARVSGIIYRERKGQIVVSAELLDKNENSVIIVDPKNVSKE